MDHKNLCQICQKEYATSELYPVALIRNSVLVVAAKTFPNLAREGFICFSHLRKISALHAEEMIKVERGVLSELEKEVVDSMSQQNLLSENVNLEFDGKQRLGERLSDKLAQFGGSWVFISFFCIGLVIWMIINAYAATPFDPFPFILLNLILSCLAAMQAPIIMMSQNRQAAKDRLAQENDYQVNLKAELQTRQLNARLELFMRHHWQKMHEAQRTLDEILHELQSKK